MSDEKRREELKAKINEQLDKFSIEDLEKVAGGAFMIKGQFHAARFRFTVDDVEKMKKHGISDVEASRLYTRSDLNNMGISADSDGELMELLRSWGIAIV
jgi:hypothetical protein